jgi:hypothetical protein
MTRVKRPANMGFAKWRQTCFCDTLVQGSTIGILMNICDEKPQLRKARNRYRQLKQQPTNFKHKLKWQQVTYLT